MNRIPPILQLSLAVALDFFTTSANTKRFAPLTEAGDFVYIAQGEDGPPVPLLFVSWEEAVRASIEHNAPYISVGGNGRVIERIASPTGGNDFGRVIPVPPAEYANYAGQVLDMRKPAENPEQAHKRARDAANQKKSRQRKRAVEATPLPVVSQ